VCLWTGGLWERPGREIGSQVTASYDVIVIGGGHAGAEAAWAASRLGAATVLVTMRLDALGRMSCNPAVGGLGKGHMVREVDALGGLMGLVTDAAGIQFRMLNKTTGPAVWAPRAQVDGKAYTAELRRCLEAAPNLGLLEGVVDSIETRAGRVAGVTLADGRRLKGDTVIVTTGTFLRGLMHTGEDRTEGGRVGEPAATGLSDALCALGLELGRLKTGTPPRVHRDSVHYDVLDMQPGDDPPVPFSYLTGRLSRQQVPCWITYTNEQTHERIRANLHRAPLFSGQIQSVGPRYCPSIEDKVVRFADKPRHQVFLEPEGCDNERVYCNGISTSLPRDVQDAMVHSIRGLEEARILQYGYAVEYDFVPTHQIAPSLETRAVGALFLAGQINGTSGYEEAAGQGIVAGINAVCRLRGDDPLILGRDEAYIGVMLDDLITRPPVAPSRMFTSRAEYRLQLRMDNADHRLTPTGRRIGLVCDHRWSRFERKRQDMERLRAIINGISHAGRPLREHLRGPAFGPADLTRVLADRHCDSFSADVVQAVALHWKYEGYLARQQREIDRLRRMENMLIPTDMNLADLVGLRREARESFARVRPRTLGQASRISGISPSDITTLWILLTARQRPNDGMSRDQNE